MPEYTTIRVPMSLRARLQKLAETKSRQLGFTEAITVSRYLETLITDEEKRLPHILPENSE